MPPVTEAVIAAILVLSMARAFFGAAPEGTDRVAAAGWMGAGLLMLATVVLTHGDDTSRLLLTAAAVECVCVAGWWLRAPGGDDGGEPAPDGDEPPIDWDAFDHARAGWRPRTPA